MRVKYRHLGWKKRADGYHKGVVTVSVVEENGRYSLGFSFCSPSDAFSRAEGRKEADLRRNENPIISKASPYGIINALVNICDSNGEVYEMGIHVKTGEAIAWLGDWLVSNFPFMIQYHEELNECRLT